MPILLLLLVTAAPSKVAVLDIATKGGFNAEQRDVISEFLQGELRRRGLEVVGRSDIEAVLGLEKMKDALACDSSGCLAELGGALGVQEIVTGQLAFVGDYVTLTVKRMDSRTSRVQRQAMRKFKKGAEQDVLDALPEICAELYPDGTVTATPTSKPSTSPVAAGRVRLRIVTEDETATYQISVTGPDGTNTECPKGVTKSEPCELDLAPGKNKIRAAGMFDDEVDLVAGLRIYRAKLVPRGWLYAAIIGSSALVVTGVVLAAIPVTSGADGARSGVGFSIAIGGLVVAAVGIPIAAVFTGNRSTLDQPPISAHLPVITPIFASNGRIEGGALAGGFSF